MYGADNAMVCLRIWYVGSTFFKIFVVFVHGYTANDTNYAVKRCICIPNKVNGKLLAIGPKEEPKYWHSMQDWLLLLTCLRRMLVTKLSLLSEKAVFVFDIGFLIP